MDFAALIERRQQAYASYPQKESTDGWVLTEYDPRVFLEYYRPLKLAPNRRLCVYEHSYQDNCMTQLLAFPARHKPPPDGAFPDLPLWAWRRSMDMPERCHNRPQPERALEHFMLAIEGDGTHWSYLLASFLCRDGEELGNSWHAADWRSHALLLEDPFWPESKLQEGGGALLEYLRQSPLRPIPPTRAWKQSQLQRLVVSTWSELFRLGHIQEGFDFPPEIKALRKLLPIDPEDWRWAQPRPENWQPTVNMHGAELEVSFHTYCGVGRQRIFRHRDEFVPGCYLPIRSRCELATGGPGYIP